MWIGAAKLLSTPIGAIHYKTLARKHASCYHSISPPH
jgi:hypothetical protein